MTKTLIRKPLILYVMEDVLKNVRAIRESKGYSQEYMGEMLKTNQSAYARFERGITKTDLKTLRLVADVFEMSIIDLFSWPVKLVDAASLKVLNKDIKEVKATISIEMDHEKKDQVFRFVFGKNDVQISTKND